MLQKMNLLLPSCLCGVERRVFGGERLQPGVVRFVFSERAICPRETVDQLQLFFRREQRLMIVRAVKIYQAVAELLQHRQCCWATVYELTIGGTERALYDQLAIARIDAALIQLLGKSFQFRTIKHAFNGAKIGACSYQRLIGSFAQ